MGQLGGPVRALACACEFALVCVVCWLTESMLHVRPPAGVRHSEHHGWLVVLARVCPVRDAPVRCTMAIPPRSVGDANSSPENDPNRWDSVAQRERVEAEVRERDSCSRFVFTPLALFASLAHRRSLTQSFTDSLTCSLVSLGACVLLLQRKAAAKKAREKEAKQSKAATDEFAAAFCANMDDKRLKEVRGCEAEAMMMMWWWW
jgi:hypothetical protein